METKQVDEILSEVFNSQIHVNRPVQKYYIREKQNAILKIRSIEMESQDLREAGLKVTTPRLKMLELLENTQQHLTAEAIHQKLLESGEEIGLATIYRALSQFEAAGLITKHHFEGVHAVFELERGPHHDHIVCIHCGSVKEFYDDIIEKRQSTIAEKLGFKLQDHTLTLYGECSDPDCTGKAESALSEKKSGR